MRLGNVGKRDRHITGLERLAVNDGLLAQRGFNQTDQLIQPDDLGFADVKNLEAEFLFCAGDDAFQNVRHERVITRRAAVADAVHKAAVYAEAAGLGAPAIVAVADPGMLGDAGGGSSGPAPAPYERMAFKAQAMDAGGAPLSLSPELIQVAASVDVRFAV